MEMSANKKLKIFERQTGRNRETGMIVIRHNLIYAVYLVLWSWAAQSIERWARGSKAGVRFQKTQQFIFSTPVFFNRKAAARYPALVSIIPGPRLIEKKNIYRAAV
jgi:hypothetical protein